MYEEYLTFRSLTAAQRALEVFRREGFRAELKRADAGSDFQHAGGFVHPRLRLWAANEWSRSDTSGTYFAAVGRFL